MPGCGDEKASIQYFLPSKTLKGLCHGLLVILFVLPVTFSYLLWNFEITNLLITKSQLDV